MSRVRSAAPPAVVLLAVLAGAACFSEEPESTGPNGDGDVVEIEMTASLQFDSADVTVAAGTTVRWRNVSSISHTTTADPSLASNPANVVLPPGAQTWHSGILSQGQTYSRTLTVPGQYAYVCLPHEGAGMVGTITVTP